MEKQFNISSNSNYLGSFYQKVKQNRCQNRLHYHRQTNNFVFILSWHVTCISHVIIFKLY